MIEPGMLAYSAHKDTFARDRLPPPERLPDFLLQEFSYPGRLNAAVELTNALVEKGFGERVALIGNGRKRTYSELAQWTDRIARTLVEEYGVEPGNRILIRGGNTPAMVACWLGATKAGAVVVNTMPMLRSGELQKIVEHAQIALALCDSRLTAELELCLQESEFLRRIVTFDGGKGHNAELDRAALQKTASYSSVPTGRDDVALLAYTSGTTGQPKATMHFHRDLLIIADGYAREVLKMSSSDVVIGSPPLAFTFGLGGLAIFPLRVGASAVVVEDVSAISLAQNIRQHAATVCFSAPTAYRNLLQLPDCKAMLSSLRVAVSAGATLPAPVYQEWVQTMGVPLLDGIGATEMLHIFISNRIGQSMSGCTGTPVTGYVARIVDENLEELPRGRVGALAVRGPTGCRYLADERQTQYVRSGWNLTGDAYWQDEEGRFYFVGRTDDMIVSAGYNIAAAEVEAALLLHPGVAECAVIGVPDVYRGQIIQAHVVVNPAVSRDEVTAARLQEHVKAVIAPYKYPRSVRFHEELPKTASGKVQRFRLRDG